MPEDYNQRKYTFKPATITELVGVSNAALRDRRNRKGQSRFTGHETDGGRYLYSVQDMLGLALVKKIIPVISSVFDAEVYAEKILNHVGVRLGLSDTYFPNFYFANERFAPIESDTKLAIFPFFGDPIFWKMGDDWPEVIGGTSNVIDLDTIAQAVPAKVVHAIKAYSEE
jgi:hypothetical protein